MKKIILAIAFFGAFKSFGQLSAGNYIVKIQNGQAYNPLSTGTNVSSSLVWDEENFKFPMGFTVDIDGKTTSDFSFLSWMGVGPSTDTLGVVNGFFSFAATDLVDRGAISGTPSSPLRYTTSGTAPNRIFKFEAFNAGFFDEGDIYGTLKDSVNFQMWVYETTNIVELRFGSSKITYPSDYFYVGNSPLFGYVKDFDLDAGTLTKAYSLTGTPSSPTVDSFTSIMSTTLPVLSSYPANGTVYRFIPKAVASKIGESTIANQFSVYPTVTRDMINVDYTQSKASKVEIVAANGQLVKTININSGNHQIDVSNLANGNYILNVANADGNASFKFVKY